MELDVLFNPVSGSIFFLLITGVRKVQICKDEGGGDAFKARSQARKVLSPLHLVVEGCLVLSEDLGCQGCGPSRWMRRRRGISGGTNNHRHLRMEVLIAVAMASIAAAKKRLQVHFIIHYL